MIPYDKEPAAPAEPAGKKPGCGFGTIVAISLCISTLLLVLGAFDDDPQSRMLVRAELAIKDQLRDPSSYQQVDQRVVEEGNGYVVVIGYRAKNGFGGYVSGSAAFEFDKGGNLLRQR